MNRTNGEYSIDGQNSLSNREWDGYCGAFDYDCQKNARNDVSQAQNSIQDINQQADDLNAQGTALSQQAEDLKTDISNKASGITAQVEDLKNKATNLKQSVENGDYLVRNIYIPSWRDYVGTSEKLFNDEFETQLLLASFCNTDSLYPYNCGSGLSNIAHRFNTSVSPNVKGLSDYQRNNTRVWYTLDEARLNNDMATLNSQQADIQTQANYLDFYAAVKGYDIQKQADDLNNQAKNLQSQLQGAQDKIKSASGELEDAQKWNTIVSIGVGVIAGVACTVATAGVGAVACAAGAGALVAGLSNLNSQFINNGDLSKTNLTELGVNIAIGGITGALGELGGQALGAGIKAISKTGVGKVAVSGISGVGKTVLGGIDNTLIAGAKALDNVGNLFDSGVSKLLPAPALADGIVETVAKTGFQDTYQAVKNQVVASTNQGASGGARAGKPFTPKGKAEVIADNATKMQVL